MARKSGSENFSKIKVTLQTNWTPVLVSQSCSRQLSALEGNLAFRNYVLRLHLNLNWTKMPKNTTSIDFYLTLTLTFSQNNGHDFVHQLFLFWWQKTQNKNRQFVLCNQIARDRTNQRAPFFFFHDLSLKKQACFVLSRPESKVF